MKAFTAQDWKYEGWIFNVRAGRWESVAHVVPGLEHQVENPVDAYAAADNASEGRMLRGIELSEVPDPDCEISNIHAANVFAKALGL